MNKFYLVISLLVGFSSTAQIVDIPDVNFKTALFEAGVDTNGDGEIQVSEAEVVTQLEIGDKSNVSLEGIQSFIALRILNCQDNDISEIRPYSKP